MTLALISICLQDFKERRVYAFLFILFGIVGTTLWYKQTYNDYYWVSCLVNLLIVTIILGVSFLYTHYYLKKHFLKEAFGLGDLWFLIGFAISFPIGTFLLLFVFSMLFSLALFIALKRLQTIKENTVPLAGSMSLFLLAIYLTHWFGLYQGIYLN